MPDAEDKISDYVVHMNFSSKQRIEETTRNFFSVWSRSTLKTPGWGWVSENKLAQLTQKCDPEAELWSGYTCYAGKIEITAPTAKHVTAPAYCCDMESSSVMTKLSLLLATLLLLL